MRLFLAMAPALVLAFSGGCAGHYVRIPTLHEITTATGLAPSDEEQITAVLDDVHRGMQQRQIYKVLAHVSPNYYDAEGRDYAAIERYLVEVFRSYRSVQIRRVNPRVAVYGTTARAVETFGASAEPNDPAVDPPVNVQGQVTVSLEKLGGEWKIVEWGSIM